MRWNETVAGVLAGLALGGCSQRIQGESARNGTFATGAATPTSDPTPLRDHFTAADRIAEALGSPGCVWVTDADGTLWSDDIGERFLQRLVRDGVLAARTGQDSWALYQQKLRVDKVDAYTFATAVMAGLPEGQVQQAAAAFAHEFVPEHLYPAMKALIGEAQARGCDIWIVSASNEWVVRAAAHELGIAQDHGLGIRVAVRDGHLTSEIVPPVNYQAGKVERIRQAIQAVPTLVSGDSAGDVEMLRAASAAPIFVQHDYTDPAVLETARSSGWWVETFAMP